MQTPKEPKVPLEFTFRWIAGYLTSGALTTGLCVGASYAMQQQVLFNLLKWVVPAAVITTEVYRLQKGHVQALYKAGFQQATQEILSLSNNPIEMQKQTFRRAAFLQGMNAYAIPNALRELVAPFGKPHYPTATH